MSEQPDVKESALRKEHESWAAAVDGLVGDMLRELGIDSFPTVRDHDFGEIQGAVKREFGESALAEIHEDINDAGDVKFTLRIINVDSRAPRGFQRPLSATRTLPHAVVERLCR